MDPIDRSAETLPKVLLHEHLDGSLRLATLWEFLERRGLQAPAASAQALARWFKANVHAGSLERYLAGFPLILAAMAEPQALERVAFEAAEDARSQGALLAEFRLAPLLFEPYGLGGDTVVEAVLSGLRRSSLATGLIICGIRVDSPTDTLRAAQLALRWADKGVVGFDLAGAELGHPATDHAEALALVRGAGLPMTLHAGEADSFERVLEAARLGARRIGHGIALAESLGRPDQAAVLDEVLKYGLHLEICPSSNIHTGVVASMEQHPIVALHRAGLDVGWNTDNTLISCVSLNSEAAALLQATELSRRELLLMARNAARASFLGNTQRTAALRQIDELLREPK